MTKGTEQIERFDYKREPPGYMVGAAGDFQNEGYCWNGERSALGFTSPEAALVGAWADYKAHFDPPGSACDGARYLAWVAYDRTEVWTNAPTDFDPTNRNAHHERWPHGFVIIEVCQGRTKSTPDSPPEGYQDIVVAEFHGVEWSAAERAIEEMGGGEWLYESLTKVPSGSFEAIIIIHPVPVGEGEGLWELGMWTSDAGAVCFHDLEEVVNEQVERLDSKPSPEVLRG